MPRQSMIGPWETVHFCLFGFLLLLGASEGPRHGIGALAGAGLGVLSFITLEAMFVGLALLVDWITGPRGGPKHRDGDK
jgi:hypothetical protein